MPGDILNFHFKENASIQAEIHDILKRGHGVSCDKNKFNTDGS